MKHELFSGVCTALVTPFLEGRLDLEALCELLEIQVESGVSAICVAGTTGECATLGEREFCRLVSYTVEKVNGRLPVVVGVGTPSTEHSCRRASFASAEGADFLLAVTPYYNKGTSEGLVRHYHAIAEAGELPVIVYNVPSRTGVDLDVPLYRRIAAHPGIVAVKEAGGGFERLLELISELGDQITVYTGNDQAILTAVALGAKGAISVLSNVLPRETVELTRAALDGRMADAREMQYRLLPLVRALFAETNPAPVKCALELCGLLSGELRLPLAPVSTELRERIAFLLGLPLV